VIYDRLHGVYLIFPLPLHAKRIFANF